MSVRSCTIPIVVALAAVVGLFAFYACTWTGKPRSSGAVARFELPQAGVRSAPFVLHAIGERDSVLLVWSIATDGRSAEASRIARHGAAVPVRLATPFDWSRYQSVTEEPIDLSSVRSTFSGVTIPRPGVHIFHLLGDSQRAITFEPARTGVERVTWRGRELVSARLFNAPPLEASQHGRLRVFVDQNSGLIVCTWTAVNGTTVWLFNAEKFRE